MKQVAAGANQIDQHGWTMKGRAEFGEEAAGAWGNDDGNSSIHVSGDRMVVGK